jgi:hypothetical protein
MPNFSPMVYLRAAKIYAIIMPIIITPAENFMTL